MRKMTSEWATQSAAGRKIRSTVFALVALVFAGAAVGAEQDAAAKVVPAPPGFTLAAPEHPAMAEKKGSAKSGAAARKPPAKPRKLVDINSASRDQLKALPGIDDKQADRIIEGRPYKSKAELATRGVLPMGGYISLKRSIVALQKETVTSEKPRKAGAPAKKAQVSAKKADDPAKKADEATTKADATPKK